MPYYRRRRLVQGQGGSTLIELLVAMPIAVMLLGLVIQSLGQASLDQQDVERRSQMQIDGQVGLERMTREIRQATWLRFRSTAVIDLNVRVRASAASTGTYRLVRYDCSGDTCMRYEGAPVAFPPPESPVFTSSRVAIAANPSEGEARRGQIINHDIFHPTRVDPATGTAVPDYVTPDFLSVRLQIQINRLHDAEPRRVVLEDGVSLRNRAGFKP
jgi:type II secretory pathway pseudopilin PulG